MLPRPVSEITMATQKIVRKLVSPGHDDWVSKDHVISDEIYHADIFSFLATLDTSSDRGLKTCLLI